MENVYLSTGRCIDTVDALIAGIEDMLGLGNGIPANWSDANRLMSRALTELKTDRANAESLRNTAAHFGAKIAKLNAEKESLRALSERLRSDLARSGQTCGAPALRPKPTYTSTAPGDTLDAAAIRRGELLDEFALVIAQGYAANHKAEITPDEIYAAALQMVQARDRCLAEIAPYPVRH